MYFEGDALMYAAVFSDKLTYECQLRRLMQRAEQLSNIYIIKSNALSIKGCDPILNPYLSNLISSASEFKDSEDIYLINNLVEDLGEKNNANWRCELW